MELPLVSIVVPTMASRLRFLDLLVNNITSQTYPHDRLEVLVVGDEDPATRRAHETRVADAVLLSGVARFRYVASDISDNIGKKRNFCCSQASHKTVAMMDDDDVYNRGYVKTSVLEMRRLKRDIVGCRDMIVTWPSLGFETRFVRGSSIHEGTMVFRKSHWRRHGFGETTRTGEGVSMVAGAFFNGMDVREVMICVAHDSNTSDKGPLLSAGGRGGAVVELGEDQKERMREILGMPAVVTLSPPRETS